MTPVLSRAEMRAFDAHASTHCGVSGLLLMENAGRGATDVLVRDVLGGKLSGARVVLVCGAGNNGGDGFVVARHLAIRGVLALVFLLGDPERMTGDARAMRDAWRAVGGPVCLVKRGGSLADLCEALGDATVVVDALFGTGLDRPLDPWIVEAIGAINAASAKRFSLDLPSGLDADTGTSWGAAVHADATATFGHPKLGLRTPHGAELAGRVHVVDIGVPGAIAYQLGQPVQELESADVAEWTRRRAPGAHKNSAGHVAVFAGSPGKVGAPQLVARGALRAGAGLVTIVAWPAVASDLEGRIAEVMLARLDPDGLEASIRDVLKGKQAVAIGPGFGVGDDARRAVQTVLAVWKGPIVVDADALTVFAGQPEAFRVAKAAILTPHPGELGRLSHMTSAQVESDRFRAARTVAAASGAVVVLKGAHTIVSAPDGRVAVSPIAAPVLATAGSGDTLGGILAALSCAMDPFEAACTGVMLHGLAGQAWSKAHGGADRGMIASDIAEALPLLRIGASG